MTDHTPRPDPRTDEFWIQAAQGEGLHPSNADLAAALKRTDEALTRLRAAYARDLPTHADALLRALDALPPLPRPEPEPTRFARVLRPVERAYRPVCRAVFWFWETVTVAVMLIVGPAARTAARLMRRYLS